MRAPVCVLALIIVLCAGIIVQTVEGEGCPTCSCNDASACPKGSFCPSVGVQTDCQTWWADISAKFDEFALQNNHSSLSPNITDHSSRWDCHNPAANFTIDADTPYSLQNDQVATRGLKAGTAALTASPVPNNFGACFDRGWRVGYCATPMPFPRNVSFEEATLNKSAAVHERAELLRQTRVHCAVTRGRVVSMVNPTSTAIRMAGIFVVSGNASVPLRNPQQRPFGGIVPECTPCSLCDGLTQKCQAAPHCFTSTPVTCSSNVADSPEQGSPTPTDGPTFEKLSNPWVGNCPTQDRVITSAAECKEAGRSLSIAWGGPTGPETKRPAGCFWDRANGGQLRWTPTVDITKTVATWNGVAPICKIPTPAPTDFPTSMPTASPTKSPTTTGFYPTGNFICPVKVVVAGVVPEASAADYGIGTTSACPAGFPVPIEDSAECDTAVAALAPSITSVDQLSEATFAGGCVIQKPLLFAHFNANLQSTGAREDLNRVCKKWAVPGRCEGFHRHLQHNYFYSPSEYQDVATDFNNMKNFPAKTTWKIGPIASSSSLQCFGQLSVGGPRVQLPVRFEDDWQSAVATTSTDPCLANPCDAATESCEWVGEDVWKFDPDGHPQGNGYFQQWEGTTAHKCNPKAAPAPSTEFHPEDGSMDFHKYFSFLGRGECVPGTATSGSPGTVKAFHWLYAPMLKVAPAAGNTGPSSSVDCTPLDSSDCITTSGCIWDGAACYPPSRNVDCSVYDSAVCITISSCMWDNAACISKPDYCSNASIIERNAAGAWVVPLELYSLNRPYADFKDIYGNTIASGNLQTIDAMVSQGILATDSPYFMVQTSTRDFDDDLYDDDLPPLQRSTRVCLVDRVAAHWANGGTVLAWTNTSCAQACLTYGGKEKGKRQSCVAFAVDEDIASDRGLIENTGACVERPTEQGNMAVCLLKTSQADCEDPMWSARDKCQWDAAALPGGGGGTTAAGSAFASVSSATYGTEKTSPAVSVCMIYVEEYERDLTQPQGMETGPGLGERRFDGRPPSVRLEGFDMLASAFPRPTSISPAGSNDPEACSCWKNTAECPAPMQPVAARDAAGSNTFECLCGVAGPELNKYDPMTNEKLYSLCPQVTHDEADLAWALESSDWSGTRKYCWRRKLATTSQLTRQCEKPWGLWTVAESCSYTCTAGSALTSARWDYDNAQKRFVSKKACDGALAGSGLCPLTFKQGEFLETSRFGNPTMNRWLVCPSNARVRIGKRPSDLVTSPSSSAAGQGGGQGTAAEASSAIGRWLYFSDPCAHPSCGGTKQCYTAWDLDTNGKRGVCTDEHANKAACEADSKSGTQGFWCGGDRTSFVARSCAEIVLRSSMFSGPTQSTENPKDTASTRVGPDTVCQCEHATYGDGNEPSVHLVVNDGITEYPPTTLTPGTGPDGNPPEIFGIASSPPNTQQRGFIFVEATPRDRGTFAGNLTNAAYPGNVAYLFSPVIDTAVDVPNNIFAKMTFQYNTYGNSIGALVISICTDIGPDFDSTRGNCATAAGWNPDAPVFVICGPHAYLPSYREGKVHSCQATEQGYDSLWRTREIVGMLPQSGAYQVRFEFIAGQGQQGDLALSGINFITAAAVQATLDAQNAEAEINTFEWPAGTEHMEQCLTTQDRAIHCAWADGDNDRDKPQCCPGGSSCPTPDVKDTCVNIPYQQVWQCKAGSKTARVCPVGFYCATPQTEPVECVDGESCPAGRNTAPLDCPAGFFCQKGKAVSCSLFWEALKNSYPEFGEFGPGNSQGSTEKATIVYEQQSAHIGATKAKLLAAGNAFAYTSIHFPNLLECYDKALHCPRVTTVEAQAAAALLTNTMGKPQCCPPGKSCASQDETDATKWNPDPARVPETCAPGEYCPTGTAKSPADRACPEGSYCTAQKAMAPCPAGRWCPPKSEAFRDCPQGDWCLGGKNRPCASFFTGYIRNEADRSSFSIPRSQHDVLAMSFPSLQGCYAQDSADTVRGRAVYCTDRAQPAPVCCPAGKQCPTVDAEPATCAGGATACPQGTTQQCPAGKVCTAENPSGDWIQLALDPTTIPGWGSDDGTGNDAPGFGHFTSGVPFGSSTVALEDRNAPVQIVTEADVNGDLGKAPHELPATLHTDPSSIRLRLPAEIKDDGANRNIMCKLKITSQWRVRPGTLPRMKAWFASTNTSTTSPTAAPTRAPTANRTSATWTVETARPELGEEACNGELLKSVPGYFSNAAQTISACRTSCEAFVPGSDGKDCQGFAFDSAFGQCKFFSTKFAGQLVPSTVAWSDTIHAAMMSSTGAFECHVVTKAAPCFVQECGTTPRVHFGRPADKYAGLECSFDPSLANSWQMCPLATKACLYRCGVNMASGRYSLGDSCHAGCGKRPPAAQLCKHPSCGGTKLCYTEWDLDANGMGGVCTDQPRVPPADGQIHGCETPWSSPRVQGVWCGDQHVSKQPGTYTPTRNPGSSSAPKAWAWADPADVTPHKTFTKTPGSHGYPDGGVAPDGSLPVFSDDGELQFNTDYQDGMINAGADASVQFGGQSDIGTVAISSFCPREKDPAAPCQAATAGAHHTADSSTMEFTGVTLKVPPGIIVEVSTECTHGGAAWPSVADGAPAMPKLYLFSRWCLPGEKYVRAEYRCEMCLAGKYSTTLANGVFTMTDREKPTCEECPVGGWCPGLGKAVPEAGWFKVPPSAGKELSVGALAYPGGGSSDGVDMPKGQGHVYTKPGPTTFKKCLKEVVCNGASASQKADFAGNIQTMGWMQAFESVTTGCVCMKGRLEDDPESEERICNMGPLCAVCLKSDRTELDAFGNGRSMFPTWGVDPREDKPQISGKCDLCKGGRDHNLIAAAMALFSLVCILCTFGYLTRRPVNMDEEVAHIDLKRQMKRFQAELALHENESEAATPEELQRQILARARCLSAMMEYAAAIEDAETAEAGGMSVEEHEKKSQARVERLRKMRETRALNKKKKTKKKKKKKHAKRLTLERVPTRALLAVEKFAERHAKAKSRDSIAARESSALRGLGVVVEAGTLKTQDSFRGSNMLSVPGSGGGDGSAATPSPAPAETTEVAAGGGGGGGGAGVDAGRDVAASIVSDGRERLESLGALSTEIDPAVMRNLHTLAADIKGLQGPFNIFFSYIQVLSFLQVTFDVDWPPIFSNVMEKIAAAVHIDPLKFIGTVSFCKMGASFGDKLLMSLLILPLLAMTIVFVYMVLKFLHHCHWCFCHSCSRESQHARHEKHLAGWDHRSALNASVRLGNMITFLLYPTLCNTIFRTFKCEQVGDRAYLRASLSVECSFKDPDWNWMCLAAIIGVIVYVIGIPLIYALVLFRRRHLLVSPTESIESDFGSSSSSKKHDVTTVRHFKIRQRWSQLFIQYESKYWYFELFEMLRKVTLTGALVMFGDSVVLQMIVGVFICFAYVVVCANAAPYVDPLDDKMQQTASIMLFLTMFAGLMTKLKGAGMQGIKDYEFLVMDWLLVIVNVGVICLMFTIIFLICAKRGAAAAKNSKTSHEIIQDLKKDIVKRQTSADMTGRSRAIKKRSVKPKYMADKVSDTDGIELSAIAPAPPTVNVVVVKPPSSPPDAAETKASPTPRTVIM